MDIKPKKCTLSGKPPDPNYKGGDAPQDIDPKTGMHKDYFILCDEERAKGFVRPVRRSYQHVDCGTVTSMGLKLAETYARDPKFYGATFCAGCSGHFPLVIADKPQFFWVQDGEATNEAVGS